MRCIDNSQPHAAIFNRFEKDSRMSDFTSVYFVVGVIILIIIGLITISKSTRIPPHSMYFFENKDIIHDLTSKGKWLFLYKHATHRKFREIINAWYQTIPIPINVSNVLMKISFSYYVKPALIGEFQEKVLTGQFGVNNFNLEIYICRKIGEIYQRIITNPASNNLTPEALAANIINNFIDEHPYIELRNVSLDVVKAYSKK